MEENQTPPVEQPPEIKKKFPVIPVVVGVVILLIIVAIGYLYLKQPTVYDTEDTMDLTSFVENLDTATVPNDWQTFQSKYYDISFKYPPDWKMRGQEGNGGEYLSTYVTMSSPDREDVWEYRGGDFPILIGWESGAGLDLQIWNLNNLAPDVKTDLIACLNNQNVDIVVKGPNWIKCLEKADKVQYSDTKVNNGTVVTISGQKALIYGIQKDNYDLGEIYVRMLDKNDSKLLVDIKLSTYLGDKDIHLDTLAKILSSLTLPTNPIDAL